MTSLWKGLIVVAAVIAGLCIPQFVMAQECNPDDLSVDGDCPGVNEPNETHLHMHYCP